MEPEVALQVPYQRQILLSRKPVPGRSVLALSILAHLVVLGWFLARWPRPKVQVVAEKYTVERIPLDLSLTVANIKRGRPLAAPARRRRIPRPAPEPQAGTSPEGTGTEILREHARQATAAIVTSIKQRQIYGFSPENYRIATWTAGELPAIAAANLPPRFEQIVIVEITIDIDGRVADARIVTGLVDPTIQQTLLAAIRDFKYNPATHNGTPIPSQLDLVIHIPT